MVPTQIYLPKSTREELRSWAYEESKSMAQKIREVLDQRLKKRQKTQPALKMIMQTTFKGTGDLSQNHDKYLYDK